VSDVRLTLHSSAGASHTLALADLVTPELAERARVETIGWIKRLRLVPYASGLGAGSGGTQTMRDRFTYRGDSLWWFTELYLHKMRALDRAVLTVLALDHARALHAPARVVMTGADAATAAAARAFGAARGIGVEVPDRAPARPGHRWAGALVGVSAALSRVRTALRPGRRPAPGPIAAFVHTAFWRGDAEGYIGPVLDALDHAAPGAVRLVGVGPRQTFAARTGRGSTRRTWTAMAGDVPTPAITPVEDLAPWASLRESRALWRARHALADALVAGPGIREVAIIHGCDLWPVLESELRGVAQVQWPWSARAMDEAGAAIDALKCHTVVTYAEAGGWGRALMLEARRRGVHSVGVQHGFIYRHWLNYLHLPDEFAPSDAGKGFPAPDLTLLFDRYAHTHLQTAGAFPAARLAVTGSPRLDDLLARISALSDADRAAMRRRAGAVREDQKLAVLTAKFTEVRDVLPALVESIRRTPNIQLAIKAHPAEVGSVYAPYISGVPNTSILEADADLARLLAVADAVVTRNSTVAIDALVLGLPALVIGQPNNLSPFVDEGVMLGADGADGITSAWERLLYDQDVRTRLAAAAHAFVERYGLRGQGSAAADAAQSILKMGPQA
jgi:hypothetical protein